MVVDEHTFEMVQEENDFFAEENKKFNLLSLRYQMYCQRQSYQLSKYIRGIPREEYADTTVQETSHEEMERPKPRLAVAYEKVTKNTMKDVLEERIKTKVGEKEFKADKIYFYED